MGLAGFEPASNWLRARYNCHYTIDPKLAFPTRFELVYSPWKGDILTARWREQKPYWNTLWKLCLVTTLCNMPNISYYRWTKLIQYHWTIVCFNMVPSLGIELSSQAYKTRASPFMLWRRIDTCPNSRRISVASHARICASKPYPETSFLKQQEQSRRTLYQPYTTIIAHKAAFNNTKNSF